MRPIRRAAPPLARRVIIRGCALRWTLLLSGAPLALPAYAQVTTQIHPDVLPGRSTGTLVSTAGHTTTIDGGTLVGGNLFDSFSTFDLAAGDTAAWTYTQRNPLLVQNVINRITGGGVSQIDGTLDSTGLPKADFFFINPAGIIFGAGAQINVPAAAYFSTASELRFADGAVYSAVTPSGSRLTIAPISSFGFLGGEGGIGVSDTNADFFTSPGKLSLSASNLQISNSFIPAGALDLFAIGSGSTDLPTTGPVKGATLAGAIQISGSFLVTTPSPEANGAMRIGGGPVDVVKGTTIASESGLSSAGGDISIQADSLLLDDAAIATAAPIGSAGHAGAITISADAVTLANGAEIQASTQSEANASNVSITANRINISNSFVTSDSYGETAQFTGGDGGSVLIKGGDIVLEAALVSSDTYTNGAGGKVTIDGDAVTLQDYTVVSSDTYSSGSAGDVNVQAQQLLVDASAIRSDAILGESFGTGPTITSTGNGGKVSIQADSITVQNFGTIQTGSDGRGDGGRLKVTGGSLTLNNGEINATSGGFGQAGDIKVQLSGGLSMQGGSSIAVDAYGAGDAGVMSITAGTVTVQDSRISSSSFGGANAGDVIVSSGGSVAVDAGVISSFTTVGGNAGRVTIDAAGSVTFDRGSDLDTSTSLTGNSGEISIHASSLRIDDSYVFSDVGPKGAAGGITVQLSGAMAVENNSIFRSLSFGTGNAGVISIIADDLLVDHSNISTNATAVKGTDQISSGNAGTITITTRDQTTVQDGGFINSDTLGVGHAGDITLTSARLTVASGGFISSSTEGSGNAGGVGVRVGDLTISDGEILTASQSLGGLFVGTGNAGDIVVDATGVVSVNGGAIESEADDSLGKGGDVRVSARVLTLQNEGAIETDSANSETAGDIVVEAPSISIDGPGATIASANTGSFHGAAGSINAATVALVVSNGGEINTNAATGSAGNITIDFPHGGLLTLEGATPATIGQITTTSGTSTAGQITLEDASAIILNGSEIQALGPFKDAFVTIGAGTVIESSDRPNIIAVAGDLVFNSQFEDVEKAVIMSVPTFVDASKVLRGQCSALVRSGESSALVTRSQGPYGRDPAPQAAGVRPVSAAQTEDKACGASPGPD